MAAIIWMRKMHAIAAILIVSLSLLPLASALSIGVSPATADLGLVERGKSYLVDFYLISDTEKDLVVDLEARNFGEEFLQFQGERRYRFDPDEASQEDIIGWIEFLENPAVVPPKRFIANVGPTPVSANKKLTFAVMIPKDAEPGYHAAFIKAVPRLKTYRGGLGVGILAITDFKVVFQVPGKAVRSGYIVGFSSQPVQEYFQMVNVIFKNNGTVTIKATGEPVIVYRNSSDTSDVFASRGVSGPVKPGEIAGIPVFPKSDDLGLGVMDIYSKVNWMTGETNRTGKIAITGFVPAQPPPEAEKREEPWTYVLFLLVIMLLFIAAKKRRKK